MSSSDGYQVAFGALIDGTENRGIQEQHIPIFHTLKQAIIAALICGKTYQDYIGDAMAENEKSSEEMRSMWASAPVATFPLASRNSFPLRVPIYIEDDTERIGPTDLHLCAYSRGGENTCCVSRWGNFICGGYLGHDAHYTLCQGI